MLMGTPKEEGVCTYIYIEYLPNVLSRCKEEESMKQQHNSYQVMPYTKIRRIMATEFRLSHCTPMIHGLIEVDVSRARAYLRDQNAKTGESLSFTAFLIACLARAVEEYKAVQASRKGRKHILIYEDVDVLTYIDRGDAPMPFIIRSASHKTAREIHEEIRAAQVQDVAQAAVGFKLVRYIPTFLFRFLFRILGRNPEQMKKYVGTVALSSVGMFGKGAGWGIPPATPPSLWITVGGIGEKPGVVDGQIAIRDHLSLTISFDHDIIDGAPAARFTQRLKDLIESGYGLDDSTEAIEHEGAEATAQKMSPNLITGLFGSIVRVGRTYTPPMGTPNGIAELQQVELNGYPQWLLIRGQDVSKPLLLFLHGGPGESNIWLAHYTMKELERYFVCVNWDQRGTGRSFRPGPPAESMTIDQFVQDTITLIEILCARFDKQKVLLLGHSWGSVLAMKVAAARPDLLHAVIGMGQVVDMKRGEDLSYQYVLEHAQAEHNRKAMRILEQLGCADTYGQDGKFVQRRWLVHYGGMMHATDTAAVVSILLNAPECSIADCIHGLGRKDMKFSCRLMGDEIMGVNLLQEIADLSVPVFFFTGRYDYTTPYVLVEQFHASLHAPYKKLIWFEHSAHMPNMEETDKFQRELIAIGDEFCSEKHPREALGAIPKV